VSSSPGRSRCGARSGARGGSTRLLLECRAGARRAVRLDSPPAVPPSCQLQRIGLAVVLALSLLAPLAVEAQQTGQPRQVGFLNVGSRESFSRLLLAFEERMVELGYVRGKDLSIVSRFADRPADLGRLAEELVRLLVIP
jgi:hypothetical protein